MANRRSADPTGSLLASLADEIAQRIAELEALVAPTVAEIDRLREAHASLTGGNGGNGGKPQERRQARGAQRRKGDAPARVLQVLQRSAAPMTGAEIGREIGNKTPHSLLAWMVASGQLVKDVETKTYAVAEPGHVIDGNADERDRDAGARGFADKRVLAAGVGDRAGKRHPDEDAMIEVIRSRSDHLTW